MRVELLPLLIIQYLQGFQLLFTALGQSQNLLCDGGNFPTGNVGISASPGRVRFDRSSLGIFYQAWLHVLTRFEDEPVTFVMGEKIWDGVDIRVGVDLLEVGVGGLNGVEYEIGVISL